MRYSLLLICLTFLGGACGQEKPIYVLKSRYNEQVNEFIDNSPLNFKPYRILVNYQIVDDKDSRIIDHKRVEGWLDKYFPNKQDEGLLCVDLENIYYDHLKTKDPDSREYQVAVDEFVKLMKFIKEKRPNLTVGFWGMVFENSTTKQDPIFEAVDVLLPYGYLPAPAEVNGLQANFDFFKKQLDISFRFADRLNKPVIPFVWYLTHGSDRELRREQIPKEEMLEYVKYIESYRSPAGSGVSGIAWWDTPSPYSNNTIKRNFIQKAEVNARALNQSQRTFTIDETFLYYFDRE